MAGTLISLQNPVFRSFAQCAGILGAKLLFNSGWTVINRTSRKVFSTPEDIPAFGGTSANNNDPVVERIRRLHLNDIENYFPFLVLGCLYVVTEPELSTANILFRLFVGARLVHTVCHLFLKVQPWRFVAFFVGWTVNAAMAYRVLAQTCWA